jgi:hypothetical protein
LPQLSSGPLGGFGNSAFELATKIVYLCVPTILKIRGYRFFFFSREGNEPRHIHIEQGDRYAKFWLVPVQLAKSEGFRSAEISELRKLVEENKDLFEEKWHEHFGSKG